jgi:hypothetical protein
VHGDGGTRLLESGAGEGGNPGSASGAREVAYRPGEGVRQPCTTWGSPEYSAWAVNTSAGIIVIDALFDYSVEDEIVNGLTKLGSRSQKHQVRDRQPRAQ